MFSQNQTAKLIYTEHKSPFTGATFNLVCAFLKPSSSVHCLTFWNLFLASDIYGVKGGKWGQTHVKLSTVASFVSRGNEKIRSYSVNCVVLGHREISRTELGAIVAELYYYENDVFYSTCPFSSTCQNFISSFSCADVEIR